MRLESKNKVNARGRVFGGEKTLACIPMVLTTREALVEETRMAVSLEPDVIEWRVDYYDRADDAEYVKDTMIEMMPILGDIPVIFTFRVSTEGGAVECSEEKRLATIKAVLETGHADVIDVEASCSRGFIDEVIKAAHAAGSSVILSNHDFKKTPSEQEIIDKLLEEQAMGADICKLAVMPQNFDDVLTLMRATYRARTQAGVDQPMITMSMADVGKISRLAGDLYGSDLSFAVGLASSAPGQIPIAVVKTIWEMME